jgi:hypothetical protein
MMGLDFVRITVADAALNPIKKRTKADGFLTATNLSDHQSARPQILALLD